MIKRILSNKTRKFILLMQKTNGYKMVDGVNDGHLQLDTFQFVDQSQYQQDRCRKNRIDFFIYTLLKYHDK